MVLRVCSDVNGNGKKTLRKEGDLSFAMKRRCL